MKTFQVEIKEILRRVIEVKADNMLNASSKVSDMYNNEEEVLDYNDLYSTDISICEDDETLNQFLIENSDKILQDAENMLGSMSLQELAVLAYGSLDLAIIDLKK